MDNRIKYLRQAHGLTQKQLAEKVGLPVTTLSNYELGKRTPPLSVFKSIATALNTSAAFLMELDVSDDNLSYAEKRLEEAEEIVRRVKDTADWLYEHGEYEALFELGHYCDLIRKNVSYKYKVRALNEAPK